ncbi:FAD-dependent oxidoreductase [Nocardioides sp. TRM66260-LWL]|uniref:FAD-dependent oxidoreductase n=1 Tax=Nocardioides sp. TRM66260-LWL TaxID=2874478 RepID=UPI001CC3386D|nr:FAD-dependent oxidoreductase [Nocardioides sp. TRM66260-LWL]MBZ5735304.1 FAD-dependent oxidoreductase [Nocardioides sp. TRM66260-LWL]
MTHVITRACCNDAACVPVCPTSCIHPTPDEPDYATAEMLYIDPDGCIDCGACVDVCPVGAISADYDLEPHQARFEEMNRRWFLAAPPPPVKPPESRDRLAPPAESGGVAPLRVAIVGSGPSAAYAAEELLGQRGLDVRIDIVERLLTPGGLVRFGVAPDHQDTKSAGEALAKVLRRPTVRALLGIEVGRDLDPADLLARYHAVIYATGAAADRALGIPGEDLAGSIAATELVAWYNGHPDAASLRVPLEHERAVVIGNGNVALDVARVLLSPPEVLARTDIADHALDSLRRSRVREVVVVGRRGPVQAAFTTPELVALLESEDLGLAVDLPGGIAMPETHPDPIMNLRLELLREAMGRSGAERVLRLRFHGAPRRIEGTDRVEGVTIAETRMGVADDRDHLLATDRSETLACGLVVRAVGYRRHHVPGLPAPSDGSPVAHREGRVVGAEGHVLDGVYVTGWAKRGANGVIGTNKRCAQETVRSVLADHAAGLLSVSDGTDLLTCVPQAHGVDDWRVLDEHERAEGRAQRRPRVKLVAETAQRDVLAGAAR